MIEVSQLTKVYGSTVAIDRLDFGVQKGEIVGFLGPNGAGKSTTMRILAGALGATRGAALIGGHDVLQEPRAVKRLVGYLPEVPPLYEEMTVRGYLRFCAGIKKASNPRAAVERTVGRVGLTSVAHRLIGHLSKGYRQRVGIAQALVHDPQVLILDEPASGLDPAQRVEIRQLVKQLAAGDTTVLLSTHVLPEVEAICDRVIIIQAGRIVAQDSVDALSNAGHSVVVKLREASALAIAAIAAVEGVLSVHDEGGGRLAVRAGSDVRAQVARAAAPYDLLELGSRGGLEDIFLQLTEAS
ncbi:MAG: ABC-2 type transport system ATP-binding protein [Myxococcota bacterium]